VALNDLGLALTQVMDAGLVHLKEMGGLDQLDHTQTTITDKGVPMLEELRKLRKLFLTGTKLTAAGVPRCKRRCPSARSTHRGFQSKPAKEGDFGQLG
jgi:hypothetical protein